MIKPQWTDAPDWAEWLTQDANGCWFWHQEQPRCTLGNDEWYSDQQYAHAGDGEPNANWEESAEHRPSQRPTLRDQFAMAALNGLLSNPMVDGAGVEKFAVAAFEVADAMLAERGKA